MNKPNIFFILTDQQSANMMSCTGNKYLKTPYMDEIANRGIRFERAYCANSECLPSRFSMITGRYPGECNIGSNHLGDVNIPAEVFEKGLGFLLKKTGYETVYAGQQHFPFEAEKIGFDVLTKDARDLLPGICVDFIKTKRDKPFFLTASFINPHDICQMAIQDFIPIDERKKHGLHNELAAANIKNALKILDEISEDEFYDKLCPPLPDNFERQENEPEAIALQHEQPGRYFKREARKHYSERDWRRHRYVYCRLTELVDAQIGILINALKESGQYDNTVIILSTDHGDIDSAHRLEHKEILYEECCRIPLVISPSAVPGMVDSENLISNGLDIIQTVLDYAGIPGELSHLKGKSLKPLADNRAGFVPRKYLRVESRMGIAVVSQNYKYAEYNTGKNAEQFYDRINDPGETRNALNDPDKLKIIEEHKTALNSD